MTLLTRLLSFRCTPILPHFRVQTFPPKNENKELLFHSHSSPVPPIFGLFGAVERRIWSAEISGIRYDVDEDEAERCPQEESLRTVLRSLGIEEADLQGDLHNFPGVRWGSLWQCNKKGVQDFFGQKVC